MEGIMSIMIEAQKYRKPAFDINQIFLNRWSPRAMSSEEISKDELMSIFEAARWAPSSYNNQPWRFLYAMRGTEHWNTFFDLLVEANQMWAKNAAALIVVISKKTFDYNGKPSITHTFDTGAAWQNMALQGALMGLVTHGMQGFDYDRARELLNVSDEFQVEAMVAVGKPGKKEDLPANLQEKEIPSSRKPLNHIVFEGSYSW
jgi:nitroreductase